MKSEMEFTYDEYSFEIEYYYEKSTFSGDYYQPPDPDRLEILAIKLLSYTTEDGEEIYCKHNPDVSHILTNRIVEAAEEAVQEHLDVYHS
tara:strand:- start:201 stop:470 length:270 start_codon:yes stop_codon:yes gene_type:complete